MLELSGQGHPNLISIQLRPCVQALGDAERASYMKGKRILEINPHHPLIKELKQRFEADKDSSTTASLASLLYETALLESGFQVGWLTVRIAAVMLSSSACWHVHC